MKHCARSTQTEVASEIHTAAVNLEAGNGQRRDLDSLNAHRKCCQKACNIHGGYGQNVREKRCTLLCDPLSPGVEEGEFICSKQNVAENDLKIPEEGCCT